MNDTNNWLGSNSAVEEICGLDDCSPPACETVPSRKEPKDGGSKSPHYDYGRVTCAELAAAKYEIDWLVQWLLVARQPCILAGAKKTLKTSNALDLAISIATATRFLGEFEVPTARRVAMMTGESGMATIQETSLRICATKQIDLASVGGLVLFEKLPRFGDEKHALSLRRMLIDDEIEVLLIDPAYLCMPGADAGNLMIQGQLLRDISEVCQEIGVTLILLHHNRKTIADPFEPPDLDCIAWAGFAEFARQWVLLGRREPFNPDDRTGTHRLWLSVGGSSGQSMLKALDISEGRIPYRHWNANVFSASEARSAVEDRKSDAKEKASLEKLDRHKRKLFTTMAKFPDGETKRTLKDRAGLNPKDMDIALSSALELGEVIQCEVFKSCRKTPFEGYKLATDGSSTASG